jgi:hypothetical protein
MGAMDVKAKFDEYEAIIRMLTARLQESVAEVDRLTSALGGAHATLRSIYSDDNQPVGMRVKAAHACLPHESPKLNPVSQLELNANAEEVVEDLATVVTRQRARADRMLLEPPFSNLPKVVPFRPSGNGSKGNGDDGD